MSGFGANPTTTTQPSLPTNQFPLSSVAVPGTASGNLTALEGGPASTDSNGNSTAPASMYVKDGSDLAEGATTDSAVTTDTAGTISAKLRGLVKISGDIWDSTNHRIRVDGSGVTQPISAASLPLPTGAATSAKQPALGTAGTASSDVITIQGIASMTALKVDGSGVTQPISGSVSVSNFPGTQPVSGTITANAGTGTFNNQQSNTQLDYDTSAGTQNLTVFGVALPASGGAVAGGTSSNPLRIDPTGTTTQPVSGTVNAAQSGTWNVTNISGTVSLPTGAATAAKQPALGTAGSASSDVLSVQGIASMTALKTDGSGVTQPVSGTVAVSNFPGTQAVSGTITANAGTGTFNNQQSNVTADYDSGAGTQTMTMFGVALPASGGAVAGGTSSNPVRTDPTGTTTQPVSGTVSAAQSGAWNITNISGTVSLPTGAATSAKQPAPGTAGSASSDVLTVQGVASMTALKVDGSGVTQPVSGTVTANQGGTWTVQPGNTANTTAWKVDGSAVTQPISGSVTANIGTTNGLALDTSVSGVLVSQGSTTSGQKGPLIQGAVTTAAPAYTTAQTSPISLTTAGAVRVDGSATTQPVSGTVSITANSAVNVAQVGGTNTDTNSGNKSAGTQRVVLATDQPQLTNALKVDGSGVTQPVSGTITANAGTNLNTSALALDTSVNGVLASQGSTTSGQKGPLVQGAVTTAAPSYTTAQTSPISLTTAGAVRVDGSATTQPVSGTVSITANSAVNVAQVAGTATDVNSGNKSAGTQRVVLATDQPQLTNALKVDGSGVTQPVSGTFWQATQPVSGTVTANVGTTNGLALDTSVNGVLVSQGSTTSGEKGPLIQGAVTTAAPSYTTAQTSPISLTTAGAVRVDGSAVTQPVSGTFWQATQPVSGTVTANAGSGTFNNQQSNITADYDSGAGTQTMTMFGVALPASGGSVAGGTATNPLRIDPTGTTTQPISAASLPLPTGAATAAKQPALGTAGSASADVITVQGVASMTALKVDGSGVTQPVSGTITANAGTNLNTSALALDTSVNGILVSQGSTTSGQKGPLIQGAVTTSAPSYTTAQSSPLSLDTSGLLRTSLKDTPSNTNNLNVNLAASAATVTVSGTVTANQGGSNWSTNVAQIGGTNVVTGGASGLLAIGGPVASGSSNADNPVKVGGAFNTTQPTVTNGQVVDAQMTARGAQIVATGVDTFTVVANAGTNLNTSALALETGGNLATLAGTVTSAKVQANVAQINGVAPSMGNGVSGTGVQRVTIASDSTGQVALAAGAATIGAVTQASGPWTSNITQFGGNNVATGTGAGGTGIPRVTVSNDSNVLSTPQATTSGGSTPSHTISASGTNATNLKNSAGQVYGFSVSNSNAAARFFKLYNTSSAPTVGTTTPIMTVQVPGNGTVIRAFPVGLAFATGISWGLTTGIADNDTGSVGTDLSVDIDYK